MKQSYTTNHTAYSKMFSSCNCKHYPPFDPKTSMEASDGGFSCDNMTDDVPGEAVIRNIMGYARSLEVLQNQKGGKVLIQIN